MKTIKYSNGHTSIYDDNLKPGDLITSYYEGYFEFVKFQSRTDPIEKEIAPLVLMIKRFNSKGKRIDASKTVSCDASYCRLAVDDIKAKIKEKNAEIKLLKNLLKS